MSGGRFDATVHRLRPTLWPLLWAHAFTGFLVAAHSGAGNGSLSFWLRGLVAGGVWAVLLGGPAAGLTAAFGKPHEQETRSPAETPILAWTALGMILAGLIIAPVIHWSFLDVYLMGLILVICHATPPIQLGQFRLGALLTLALGFGALTLWSGYAAAGMGIEKMAMAGPYLGAFAFLSLAMQLLISRRQSPGAPILFGIALVGAFTCIALGFLTAGQRWHGATLFLPSLGAWTLLGLARYNPPRGRDYYVPALGLICLAWVLTDASLVMSILLG